MMDRSIRRKTIKKQPTENGFVDEFTFIRNYGVIHFPGFEEPVKYVRTDQRTTQFQWNRILAGKWNLKPPTLIISLLGNHAELSKRFKSTFKKGLWKAAEGAGCWIISDGLDYGMTKIAGEAARDYREAYGGDHMLMVGISHTENVTYQELFDLANQNIRTKENMANVLYPDYLSDEETDEITNTATTSLEQDQWPSGNEKLDTNLSSLKYDEKLTKSIHFLKNNNKTYRINPNTQYLILVDSCDEINETRENRLLEARIMLERTIITWAKNSGDGKSVMEQTGSKPIISPSSKEVKTDKESKSISLEQSAAYKPSISPRPSMTLPVLTDGIVDQALRRNTQLFSGAQLNIFGNRNMKPPELNTNGKENQPSEVQIKVPAQSVDLKNDKFLENLTNDLSGTTNQSTVRVPICGIVAGGNNFTLDHVYASVVLNRCPMVLIRGSGGVADILSNVLDFMSFKNTLEETAITDKEIDYKIASIIQEVREETQNNKLGGQLKNLNKTKSKTINRNILGSDLSSHRNKQPGGQEQALPVIDMKECELQVCRLRELADEYAHLLSVFESDETDLDGYMISALLSSAGIDRPKHELNLDQLEITIRLNRADIARTKIFLEGKRWKKGDLDEFMFNIILNEQTDFVRLLLENGFNLEEFLTVHTLERLYTECMKKTDFKSSLLHQLWKSTRIYKMDWVMLRDIGRLIKKLLGDIYCPLYLSKRFHRSVVECGYDDSSDEEEKNDHWDKITGENDKQGKFNTGFNLHDEQQIMHSNGNVINEQQNRINLSDKSANFLDNQNKQSNKLDNQNNKFSLPQDKHDETDDRTSYSLSSNSSQTKLFQTKNIKHSHNSLINHNLFVPKKYESIVNVNIQSSSKNGRRAIVKPIPKLKIDNGLLSNNLKNNEYNNNGYLSTTTNNNHSFNKTHVKHLGQRRIIGIHQSNFTKNDVPKAEEELANDLKTVQTNYGFSDKERVNNSMTSSIKSDHLSPVHGHGAITITIQSSLGSESPKPSEIKPRTKRMTTKSLDRMTSSNHNIYLSVDHKEPRRISVDRVRRVAHSVLHPLSDPEKARLRLREIERQTNERRKEKERKRRHRIAQEKFTIIERLTGKAKAEKLEELKPSKLANFKHTRTVKFDRPARELMMMCVLLGRFEMAEIFWNQEKEPIAAALIISILGAELGKRSDDVAIREEYEENARSFEEKADQVLEECYQEDRRRTLLILYRQLEYYGNISVIRLAARGKCIRFMANPGCQDLLSGVWSGSLSTKNTWIQLISSIILGLSIPILIPQTVRYESSFDELNNQTKHDEDESNHDSNSVNLQSNKRRSTNYDKTINAGGKSAFEIQLNQITKFYQAPMIRFVYNTIFYLVFLILFSKTLLTSITLSFSYWDIFITLMVGSFLCEELKQAFGPGSSLREYISDGWNKLDCLAISLYIIGLSLKIHAYESLIFEKIDELNIVSTNLENNSSILWPKLGTNYRNNNYIMNDRYENYTKQIYNLSHKCYENCEQLFLTNQIRKYNTSTNLNVNSLIYDFSSLSFFSGSGHSLKIWSPDLPIYILTNHTFTISRIFFAFSLFAFYVRLMYIFSFSIVLGPKLIMINRMVVHDLLPFLLILLVCLIGYGIAFQSISFADGYFSDYEQDKMTVNSVFKFKPGIRSLYDAIMTSYFQMLGEFRLDDLEGEGSLCRDTGMCPQTSSRRLTIIMLSFYILLTQVLMFNLLVATFTSTYNEIEGSAQYFWCYQRYEMIQEFVDRPSVAPPFMLLWYSVEFTSFLFTRFGDLLLGRSSEEIKNDDPFCRSLHSNPSLNQKLTKWEHMMGTRRTKADIDVGGGRKWTGRARGDTHAIVLRSVGAGASGAAAGKGLDVGGGVSHVRQAGDPGSILQGLGPIFGPETEFIEDRFYELGNQISRLGNIEERLGKISQGVNRVIGTVKTISEQQKQIISILKPTNGKRLVGWGKHDRLRSTGESKNLLLKEVCNAIAGLDSHCSLIEDKIEEKIRIEEQCVKAILTRKTGEEIEPDIVLAPPAGPTSRGQRITPASGKIYERLIISHRLWRIVPFNFEIYPGIRMNVPSDKINWKVPYEKYRTFSIADDRIALPYAGVEDSPDIPPQTIKFNCYDNASGVNRQSLRGRVRTVRPNDQITNPQTTCIKFSKTTQHQLIPVGYPLNPVGRTGLSGKGLLPHWGPNHALVIAVTKNNPNAIMKFNLPIIQVGLLQNNQNLCLPWYLIDHREDCDFRDCSAHVIKLFIQRRLANIFQDNVKLKTMLLCMKSAVMSIPYTGLINDHLNADHAWIEAVLINIHENQDNPFPEDLLQIFLEQGSTEEVAWYDMSRLVGMRSSHDELLARIALHLNVFYSEALAEKQLNT